MNKNDLKKDISVFEDKEIRRVWHNEQWFLSVIDVVAILTSGTIPRRYWSDLKKKLAKEGSEVYEKIVQLKMTASDGKSYETDAFSLASFLTFLKL